METYTKLSHTLLDSTVWVGTEPHIKLVWIVLLAKTDSRGRVLGSIPGLAKLAEVTIAQVESALEMFLEPDPYSRTSEHEGRRLEKIDGGWKVLNHARYRDSRDPEKRREQNREAKRRQREREADNAESESANVSQIQPKSAHTDTDTEDQEYPSSSLRSSEGSPLASKNCPYEAIRDLWVEHTGQRITKPERWHQSRKDAVRRLWANGKLGDELDEWRACFEFVAKSPFLMGDNPRKWRADFDWVLEPKHLTQIEEGKFHD